MGKRFIDANELKQRILVERDKIPFTLPAATYEFGIAKPNHHGNSMRGGIRKALRCMEQCKTVDAVEVVRCKNCKHWIHLEDGMGDCTNGRFHIPGVADICMNAEEFCCLGERKYNG